MKLNVPVFFSWVSAANRWTVSPLFVLMLLLLSNPKGPISMTAIVTPAQAQTTSPDSTPAVANPAVAKLVGTVTDAQTGQPLAAWVRVVAEGGSVINDWKLSSDMPGFACDGAFSVEVPAGKVKVAVHRRASHQWGILEFDAKAGQTVEHTFALKPWIDLRSKGWYCGDSHNHVNVPVKKLVGYARALGVDYLDLCQGWAYPGKEKTVTGEQMQRYLAEHSTADLHLHFGAERPKTRYGHTWWINLAPFELPHAEYMGWHDVSYYDFSGKFTEPVTDVRKQFPFRNELNFRAHARYRARGGAAIAAHPTSWWTDKPDCTLIATNITAELPFSLLAGGLIDGMVVMGYDPDHIFYQNLWFNLLNEGYDLPGLAESDGCVTGKHRIGRMASYIQSPAADRGYSPANTVAGLRKGRITLSSGPVAMLSVNDGEYQMGDHVPADGTPVHLCIEVWADPDPEQFISHVIVYRNGAIYRHIDLTKNASPQPMRQFRTRLAVAEAGDRAWYVVKAYGADWPEKAEQFDVMGYAKSCESQKNTDYVTRKKVAITNPVYFTPKGWQPPAPVVGDATIRVRRQGQPVAGVTIRATNLDVPIATAVTDQAGVVRMKLPPTAEIHIEQAGLPAMHKSIQLDYDPVNDCIESCFSGKWRTASSTLSPGQVPWSAFRFRELRDRLEKIDWTIELP